MATQTQPGGAHTLDAQGLAPDGTVQVTDETTVRIKGVPNGRILDYEVTLKAPAGKPAVFGDTKEGSMAIRLPLWMTPSHKQGKAQHQGKGTIINAEAQPAPQLVRAPAVVVTVRVG